MATASARTVRGELDLHHEPGARAATLYLREETGHDAHVSLDAGGLRALVARGNAVLLALDPARTSRSTPADEIARDFALAFARLRELERTDPAGADRIRQVIEGEARAWYATNSVPMVTP